MSAKQKSKLELLLSVKKIENKEIYPSQRFKDAGSTITIRAIDDADYKDAQVLATKADGELDELKLSMSLIEKAIVEPTVAELREATGAMTNELALKAVFNIGERAKISEQVLDLSGFQKFDAQVEEAKK